MLPGGTISEAVGLACAALAVPLIVSDEVVTGVAFTG